MANIIAIAPQEKIFQTTIDFYMLFDEQKKQLEEKLNTVKFLWSMLVQSPDGIVLIFLN